jgi:N-acetylmuramoyl-L-alanine amidase
MFGRFFHLAVWRGLLAWLGLLLMTVSFAWWQWTSVPEQPEAAAPPVKHPFSMVVLDPGHGGQDSGATVGGLLEKDLTFDIAQRVDRLLQSQGLATVMTRVGDSYVSLADRAALTNRVPDCILVSIHFNEGNKPVSSGIETYYADHQVAQARPMIAWLPFFHGVPLSTGPNLESQSLAGFVQEALVARTQAVNRGTKAQQFFVIANVDRPAVLVEGGFLTNKDDIAKLANDDYRERIAVAISEGIFRYRDLLKERDATLAAAQPQPTE